MEEAYTQIHVFDIFSSVIKFIFNFLMLLFNVLGN